MALNSHLTDLYALCVEEEKTMYHFFPSISCHNVDKILSPYIMHPEDLYHVRPPTLYQFARTSLEEVLSVFGFIGDVQCGNAEEVR